MQPNAQSSHIVPNREQNLIALCKNGQMSRELDLPDYHSVRGCQIFPATCPVGFSNRTLCLTKQSRGCRELTGGLFIVSTRVITNLADML